MTMTLVETLAEALGHKRTPNSRCLARVAETPPQLRPPGPHNPPMWCCLPQGHDGQHRHNGGGMYLSIPFRDTDTVVMGDPLPDYCEKCRCIWPCPDVQAITAALSAHPAQSVAIYPVGHFIETSAGEYGRVSREHECDGDVFQLYRSTGNAQSVDVRNVVLKSLRHATTKVVELEVTADGERIGIITFPASAVGRRYKMVRINADLQEQAE